MKKLARELVDRMPLLTVNRSADVAMANAQINQASIENTIIDLRKASEGHEPPSAIVVAAGPSLHRQNSVSHIVAADYQGTIIAADGALSHCLREGLIPDYVVTLDPHPSRIARWFGDPNIDAVEDDYFRRQDLDPDMGVNELQRNQELIELVNKHGPNIKLVASTSVSSSVTKRCNQAGMPIYWWNPLFDDIESPNSLTRQIFNMNGVPCMVSGGNVGSAAWVFAHGVLGIKSIAVVGMDFSYAPDTPLNMTQYFNEMSAVCGDNVREAYIDVYNPSRKETWFTDPAYYWYRQMFLEMTRDAACQTFNCTEGGILFGKGVKSLALNKFLASY